MKLLSHNMLKSCCKGVRTGYPLRILVLLLYLLQPVKVEVKTVNFEPEFISRMIPKLEWSVLKTAAESVGHGSDLPDKLPDSYEDNEAFLRATHHVLLEVELVEGELECPDTGRKYPVSEGIPNMLLHEDEIQQ